MKFVRIIAVLFLGYQLLFPLIVDYRNNLLEEWKAVGHVSGFIGWCVMVYWNKYPLNFKIRVLAVSVASLLLSVGILISSHTGNMLPAIVYFAVVTLTIFLPEKYLIKLFMRK